MAGSKHIALLACRHSGQFDPAPHLGDTVYCRRCNDYTRVVVASVEWALHCPTCRWGCAYGADEVGCRQAAAKHVQRFTTHVVRIKSGGKVVDELRALLPDPLVTESL